MAYTLDIGIVLGDDQTGLTLKGQLVDSAGSNVGGEITSGFAEIGLGNYLFHYTAFPDGHRGGVKFYTGTLPSGLVAFAAVNPEEAENTDAKTSTRSTVTTAQVNAECDTALADYDAPTNAEMVARTLSAADYATAANQATIAGYIDTEVSAIKAVTDKLDTAMELDGSVWRFTTNALEQAPTGGADVTAIKAVTDKLSTMIEVDGPVWRYTVNALEQAPTGGDATAANQTAILSAIAAIEVGSADEIVIEETCEELVLES